MKAVILQSAYFPWRGYFDLIHDADIFCFYDEVKYTKNDWRNRNKIYSPQGVRWLSIPLSRDAVKQKISSVTLPSGFEVAHLDALRNAYDRAPHWDQLEALQKELYQDNHFTLLSKLNQYATQKIASLIGVNTRFVDSADYDLKGDRIERLVNLLNALGATEYITGPSAKNYLAGAEHLFEENKVNLSYKDYGEYPKYPQTHEPFEPFVSILDLIANVSYSEMPNYIWARR